MKLSEIEPRLKEKRIRFGMMARHNLVIFAVLNTPRADAGFDPAKTRFSWQNHHYLVAGALEDVANGKCNRLEIEMPPRYGKSELAVRNFVVWWMARNPDKSMIVVTHTDTLAQEHGRDCRDYWTGPGFALAFGLNTASALRADSQAKDRLQTKAGGVVTFSGRGGLGAGVGADLMIFDDFFKNSAEAESMATRDEAWRTFISDCQTRLNNQDCPVIIIGSRRNEDDVQGRLFDETNPHYDENEAKRYRRIRLPALSEGADIDPLKRPLGGVMWPEKFDKSFYEAKRNHKSDIVRADFQTQDQCNPRPQEGTWFKKSWLKTYNRKELPLQLRIYVASDHAYRIGDKNDSSCLLVVGIDPTGMIYVLPDTVWRRMETDELVDEMFRLVKEKKPAHWWAARDAISGSILPLLKRKMLDTRRFFYIDDTLAERKDLVARSASIRGLMAMGQILWPADWPQWSEAENQMLSFPGKHDDLIAALSILGMGMDKLQKADIERVDNKPVKGTWAWHTWGQDRDKSLVKGWV